jgi:hypothetical protein
MADHNMDIFPAAELLILPFSISDTLALAFRSKTKEQLHQINILTKYIRVYNAI